MHSLIVHVLLALLITAAAGCQSTNTSPHAAEVDAAFAKLHLKMNKKEADAVLDPLATEKSIAWWGAHDSHRYRMIDGREIWLSFKNSPPFNFTGFSKLQGPTRWDRGRFEPRLSDVEQAVTIAHETLQRDLLAKVDLKNKYPFEEAGRPVWSAQHRLPFVLKTPDGKTLTYTAAASGQYRVHQFIHLDIDRGTQWVHRVTVNMTKKRVDFLDWTPSQDVIDELKPIALKELRKRTNVPDNVICDVFGEYDFEPNRRLIHFSFEFDHGSVYFVSLDADTGKPAYPDDEDADAVDDEDVDSNEQH